MNELALVQNFNGGGDLRNVDPAAVAAATSAKARIESAFMIALHKPRNVDQSRDRILHACKRPTFAEKVEFAKPVGGKTIKGPSVRFAELAGGDGFGGAFGHGRVPVQESAGPAQCGRSPV